MRRLTLLFTLVLSLALAQPRAVVEKTIVDVGKVVKGEVIKVEFRIKNEGSEVLRIGGLTPA